MLELFQTSRYKKHLKKYKHKKEILQELSKVIELLVKEQRIPPKYRNHNLTGDYNGLSELHIKPDDLLVYYK